MSIHPIDLMAPKEHIIPLRELPQHHNRKVMIRVSRLPGWTGGQGFYGGDGDDFVVVILNREVAGRGPIKAWQPLQLSGFWREDEWGGGWFQAETIDR